MWSHLINLKPIYIEHQISTNKTRTKFFSRNKTTSLFSSHINSNRLGNINVKLDNCHEWHELVKFKSSLPVVIDNENIRT